PGGRGEVANLQSKQRANKQDPQVLLAKEMALLPSRKRNALVPVTELLNMTNLSGWTILHFAAHDDNLAVGVLNTRNQDSDVVVKGSKLPTGSADVVRLLLAAGISVTKLNNAGKPALTEFTPKP